VRDFEMPCIRCGDCAAVCPEQLQPQQLLWDIRADRLQQASAHRLFDCSECGRCDLVCPSHISLVRRFVESKSAIGQAGLKMAQAAAARERYETRNARLLREAAERAAREAALAQQATSTDAVAAAIERAKARRQQPKDRP
jgi:electron transport complex protein RnfC